MLSGKECWIHLTGLICIQIMVKIILEKIRLGCLYHINMSDKLIGRDIVSLPLVYIVDPASKMLQEIFDCNTIFFSCHAGRLRMQLRDVLQIRNNLPVF